MALVVSYDTRDYTVLKCDKCSYNRRVVTVPPIGSLCPSCGDIHEHDRAKMYGVGYSDGRVVSQ